ncbi:MAG: TatA/E family twin arginine-targeting protein translocase [Cyanobacteria bacterium K_DeepCast_35m_m1_288]|nr:TatA/E family twin arginine-targeting protein translocase [Cyanobacteria bacterium K_DeepCast_35m_m1_288]
MNVFGVGLPELAVIAAIGLLVFGPKRLPELGKTLGRTLKGFQSASSEFEKEFRKAVDTVEAEVTATSMLPAEQAQAAAPEPSAQPQASSAAPEHSPEA